MPTTAVDRVAPQADQWPVRARALTTTRASVGASRGPFARFNLAHGCGDEPGAVEANRRSLEAATSVRRIQWLRQVHGARCVEAAARAAAEAPEADAAWTREPGVGVAVLTADCVPVAVADRGGSVVGVAHGGWRGLVGGVIASLVAALPVPPEELVAWLGPAIGPDAYEVGDEVLAAVAALPDGDGLLRRCARRDGDAEKPRLDLLALSDHLLRAAGVTTVLGGHWCSHGDARFYSYRRDGTTGRMATVAWLE
ncbi:MAG: peptidoglycan editing factor PgeF [Pseudomonadota bacterium]